MLNHLPASRLRGWIVAIFVSATLAAGAIGAERAVARLRVDTAVAPDAPNGRIDPNPASKLEDRRESTFSGTITLRVDATDVTRGIFRIRETVPVSSPGRLVLLYPKWLPGYHFPAGPISKLGGLVISAGGKSLSWRRDPLDVYAFHVSVPDGVAAIEVEFQYLSPVTPQQGRIVATADILAIEWNTVVLYPQGYPSDSIRLAPSVKLPAGWSFATALDVAGEGDEAIRFQPVMLDTLVDSPFYAGRHFQRFDLDPDGRSAVWLNIFADRPTQIALSADKLEAHRRLVRQTDKLFGARPFERYDFLLTLSHRLGGYGLEHRRSSENGLAPDYLLDWERSVDNYNRRLLPHEYVHSWNGKFRRSTGLLTPHFNAPVSNTMLWMYEGLTEYWGYVLTARSGLLTTRQSLDTLAELAAVSEHRAGRTWRSLSDTTYDPVLGHNAPLPWPNWQRGGDYYPEGPLFWLDVDTKIRELSSGERSLDDFGRRFFGMASAAARPSGYDFDDVVAALNAVQPHDWPALLNAQLTGRDAPLDGLKRGGWRLVYRSAQSAFGAAVEGNTRRLDLSFSVGFIVDEAGVLSDVRWGSPAFDAGLTIGTELIAVEGLAYAAEDLKHAIAAAKDSSRPIQLLVANADRYRMVEIDCHSGLRYPHLEQIAAAPDRISAILAPRE